MRILLILFLTCCLFAAIRAEKEDSLVLDEGLESLFSGRSDAFGSIDGEEQLASSASSSPSVAAAAAAKKGAAATTTTRKEMMIDEDDDSSIIGGTQSLVEIGELDEDDDEDDESSSQEEENGDGINDVEKVEDEIDAAEKMAEDELNNDESSEEEDDVDEAKKEDQDDEFDVASQIAQEDIENNKNKSNETAPAAEEPEIGGGAASNGTFSNVVPVWEKTVNKTLTPRGQQLLKDHVQTLNRKFSHAKLILKDRVKQSTAFQGARLLAKEVNDQYRKQKAEAKKKYKNDPAGYAAAKKKIKSDIKNSPAYKNHKKLVEAARKQYEDGKKDLSDSYSIEQKRLVDRLVKHHKKNETATAVPLATTAAFATTEIPAATTAAAASQK